MSMTYKEKNITIYTCNLKLNSNGIEKKPREEALRKVPQKVFKDFTWVV